MLLVIDHGGVLIHLFGYRFLAHDTLFLLFCNFLCEVLLFVFGLLISHVMPRRFPLTSLAAPLRQVFKLLRNPLLWRDNETGDPLKSRLLLLHLIIGHLYVLVHYRLNVLL